MLRKIFFLSSIAWLSACESTSGYFKTVPSLDLDRYIRKWYVIASRPTMFESNAYNATETYVLDKATGEIEVDFRYNKGGFAGDEKKVPQTATVHNAKTKAHWKIKVWFLPFMSFDYLVLDIEPNYRWAVVGVPNQKYLWVLGENPEMSDAELQGILERVSASGYSTSEVKRVPQESSRK